MSRPYQICSRCVMDTSDPDIQFDEQGVCNHCTAMLKRMESVVNLDSKNLDQLVNQIKQDGRGKRYDCILGISGGVDSSYLANLCHKLGLRPLAVHLDNGWDSELAIQNIEHILNKLGIDLYTKVLDWDSFKDLQLAFLKASTPDSEIPTDHAIHATLYEVARREKIRYIIQGMNMRTEGIMPVAWTYGAYDWRYIKSVHQRFGAEPLRDFPHFSLRSRIANFLFRRFRVVCLLNLFDYDKNEALTVLKDQLGWRDYGGKHGESIYTRFFQSYILRKKFRYDKRRAHQSCLVISGLIPREQALANLASDPFTPDILEADREYVMKKLGLTEAQFEEIMALPLRTFRDFPNDERKVKMIGIFIRWGRRRGLLAPQSGL